MPSRLTPNAFRLPTSCRWIVIAAVVFSAVFAATASQSIAAEPKPEKPAADADTPAAEPDDLVERLTEKAKASLAVITFIGREGKQEGLGTGFVISADGLIATNRHVIGDARPLNVQLADGRKFDVVSVHASDRALDLAVIKIDAKNLPALPLGDSDTLKQGQAVIALGNPQGLKYSVVTGVVSGVREMQGRKMIQLAIPIEPGNSGGPLLDRQGRVHGILTMKSLVTANLGFAMTINALKPLLEKPNPIEMSRWLTIGVLDPREWSILFGGDWRQHAGHLHAGGTGGGFGGRTLCLWQGETPKLPFEVAVSVKLDDEQGAAGLAFGSDGDQMHFGFYPSAGRLRLSRFDGSDVLSWRVMHDESNVHYQPGQWNRLRVRMTDDTIRCYVNDHLAVEAKGENFAGLKVGLAKFRQTQAEFRQFRVGEKVDATPLPAAEVARLTKLIGDFDPDKPSAKFTTELAPQADTSMALLRRRADALEAQVTQLRRLAGEVHEQRVIAQIAKLFEQPEDKVDLFRAGLLVAQLDNEEIDVDAYLSELRRLGRELADSLPKKATEAEKLTALGKFLFEQNGFHGSRGDYYNKANSYLNEVLDDREGLPITLAVLYMSLAHEIGLRVVGVSLPGHFCVQHIPAKGEPQLIDVYEEARPFTRAEAAEVVRRATDRELDDDDLAPAAKRAIVLRMVRNLMNIAGGSRDAAAVLKYLNLTLTLDPDAAQERWMRAVVGFQLKRPDVALADLDWLSDKQPDGIDLNRVHELRELVSRLK